MRSSRRVILVSFAAFLYVGRMGAAVTPAAPLAIAFQILPDASSLNLTSPDQTVTLRQASTPIRISVKGMTFRPIEIYACLDSEEAMRLAGNSSALATANLRIRNIQGQWTELEPLPELGGRRGVRIAVVNAAYASILLQVQLQVPPGQRPGNYQGSLTLLAQER